MINLCFYRRWNTASRELQSHVITSRSRKADASRHTTLTSTAAAPTSPSTSSSIFGAITNRVSRFFSPSIKEDTSERNAIVPATASKPISKRSYGFATSNLSHFSDQHSEDLYRYKNLSSDYMREMSPTREEPRPAITLGTDRDETRRYHNEELHTDSANRDTIAKRNKGDAHSTNVSNTRRIAFRRNDDDDDYDDISPPSNFASGGFPTRRKDEEDDE